MITRRNDMNINTEQFIITCGIIIIPTDLQKYEMFYLIQY